MPAGLFPTSTRGTGVVLLHLAEWSFVARVSTTIGRHVPSKAAAAARFFSLGDAERLRAPFRATGLRVVETTLETRRFPFPSFEAYFEPIDAGCGNVALEYISLPPDVRPAVPEDVRREWEGAGVPGSPVEVEVEILFASGRKSPPTQINSLLHRRDP
jgi:hypothetical protein